MVGKTNVGGGKLFAVIAVTYPAGSICTCISGSRTLRARRMRYSAIHALPEAVEELLADMLPSFRFPLLPQCIRRRAAPCPALRSPGRARMARLPTTAATTGKGQVPRDLAFPFSASWLPFPGY